VRLGSLKRLALPRLVAGFMIQGGFMAAVRVYKSVNSVEIDHAAVREIRDASNIEEEIGEFFRTEGLEHQALVTGLSSSCAFIRTLTVGFQDVGRIEKIVKYQMEPLVPHPIEDLVVDFLAPGPGGEIVTAGVTKALLGEHLHICARAGLDPKAVALDDIGLFFLYLQCRPGRSGIIVNTCQEKTVIQAVSEDRMEFIRILAGGRAGVDELAETLGIYRLKFPESAPQEILLTGEREEDEAVREIEARTGIKAYVWQPFDEMKNGAGKAPPDLQAWLTAPLGLAVSLASLPAKGFNLRKEEFAPRSGITPGRMAFYAAAVVFILALLTFNLQYKVSVREGHERELAKKMEEVFRSTFPGTTTILKGREFAQMRQKMESEMSESRWFGDISTEGIVLNVLEAVSRSLVEFPDVRIENFSMEGKEIRLDGRASSFEIVDRLEKKFDSQGVFNSVKLVGAKMDRNARTVTFNFAMEKGA